MINLLINPEGASSVATSVSCTYTACDEHCRTTLIVCVTVLAVVAVICYCIYRMVIACKAAKYYDREIEYSRTEERRAKDADRKRREKYDELITNYAERALKFTSPEEVAKGCEEIDKFYLCSKGKGKGCYSL